MSNIIKTPLRNHQNPRRLHGCHVDDALENQGVGPISRKEEIWKLICRLFDIFLGHPICHKPPRLLSGTTSVLFDSMDDALENQRVGPLSWKADIWKLIFSFLDVSLGKSIMSKTTKTHLRNHQCPLRLHKWHMDDALENPGVQPFPRKVEI